MSRSKKVSVKRSKAALSTSDLATVDQRMQWQASLDRRAGDPAKPGDVYVCERDGDAARIAFVVVWQTDGRSSRSFVVPLDDCHEQSESPWDVSLSLPLHGARIARCDLGAELALSQLRRRVDRLASDDTARVAASAGLFVYGGVAPRAPLAEHLEAARAALVRLAEEEPLDESARLREPNVLLARSALPDTPHQATGFLSQRWLVETNPVRYLSGHFDRLRALGPPHSDRWYEFVRHVVWLRDQGILRLPTHAARWFAEQGLFERDLPSMPPRLAPRVVALLVTADERDAIACPIRVEPSGTWHLPSEFSFGSETLIQLLDAFDHALGPLAATGSRRARAWTIGLGFGHPRATGRSVDIAALLAVLDAEAGKHSPLLSCATALVELDTDSRRLVAVKGAAAQCKLDAFFREFDRASLVVCAREQTIPRAYRDRIDRVLVADTLTELAAALAREGALAATHTRRAPLDAHQAAALHVHLDELLALGRFAEALGLSQLALSYGFAAEVDTATRLRPRRACVNAWIRLGEPARALDEIAACRAEVEAREGHIGLIEELDTMTAASLYYVFGFEQALQLMAPWMEWLRDPRQASILPVTRRAAMANTVSRNLSALGREGWGALFVYVLPLQQRGDEGNVTRTRCELLRCQLRADALDEAEALLESIERERERFPVSPYSREVLVSLQADLHRRRGRRWEDAETERTVDADQRSESQSNSYLASYLQATARQPRPLDDALVRVEHARRIFERGTLVHAGQQGNVMRFLATSMALLAAGLVEDATAWRETASRLREYLDQPIEDWRREFFGPVLDTLDGPPSRRAAEAWLDRNPLL